MQNQQPDEIFPDGVELYDFEDFDGLRKRIFDTTKETVLSKFPVEYGGFKLDLSDVDYADPEHYTISEQKQALMKNKYLGRRLRGTINMRNVETDELVDSKHVTLMNVPYLTNRGTFIHNGNEYSTINQFRLEPGIYSRRKDSGEYEAHINPARGTGTSYRVRFEPETALYKFDFKQSSIRLYPVLKLLGVSDDRLREAWGDEIFEINRKDDKLTLEKLYNRFAKKKYDTSEKTEEEKIEQIKNYFSNMKFSKEVIQRTLPSRFQ